MFRAKTEVGLIAAFLAHRFLQKHGTRLDNPIQLTARDLCELYAKVRLDMTKYEQLGGGVLELLGRQRRTVPNKFQDTRYFINDHHANQFRKVFPQIWSALDSGVKPPEQAAFESAVKMLRNQAPTTYLSLQKAGVIA